MADFLLAPGSRLSATELAQHMIVSSRARVVTGECGGLPYATARVDNPTLFGHASDEELGVAVILGGRIALTEHEWDAAERLPYRGGVAARHVLNAWMLSGRRRISDVNGACVIVVLDRMHRRGYIRTDRIGAAPVFFTRNERQLVIGSHPDAIANVSEQAGYPLAEDDVTLAEFVRTGTATHPHTYFKDVLQLDAASEYVFEADGGSPLRKTVTYWRPAVLDGAAPASRLDFVEELSEAFKTAGRLRSSPRLGTPAVLLSAGADSRGVLLSLRDPAAAFTYTYYDVENPELERARRIAELAGATHSALRRSPSYYIDNASETVRLTGGMWSLESGHHTGFVDDVWQTPKLGTVLTGCWADYLLKGIALNVEPVTLMGRSLPIYRLGKLQYPFHHPFTPLVSKLEDAVERRLDERFSKALADGDRQAMEFLRLSPVVREADAAGRLSMWRQLPIDPIMADTHVLEAYGRQSIGDKLSGIAFGQAVARICGSRVASVANNNYGAPVGTGELGRITSFAFSVLGRKLAARTRQPKPFELSEIANYGSWPNFQAVLKRSETARRWYDEISANYHFGLLPPDRQVWDFQQFVANDCTQLMRLMTVLLWKKSRHLNMRPHRPQAS